MVALPLERFQQVVHRLHRSVEASEEVRAWRDSPLVRVGLDAVPERLQFGRQSSPAWLATLRLAFVTEQA
ncbi:hypothetical protein FF100_00175 [Methylobacterium terricola]|uniref:Uncharacterized protein n=1 Tax=Methylobacterium terricola TaxID=2583531 RepID=A0A5C4LLP3_9HYPH|nr:hypothetical protein [Methylobacterium terricola]TNC15731.1 hypothetical protein FF100_00175 [Methylobacterium terricola]